MIVGLVFAYFSLASRTPRYIIAIPKAKAGKEITILKGSISFTKDASILNATTETTSPPKCVRYQYSADHFKSVPQCGHGAFLGNPAPVEKALRSFCDNCLPQLGHSLMSFKDVGMAAQNRCVLGAYRQP